jgi:hypothetical protein
MMFFKYFWQGNHDAEIKTTTERGLGIKCKTKSRFDTQFSIVFYDITEGGAAV